MKNQHAYNALKLQIAQQQWVETLFSIFRDWQMVKMKYIFIGKHLQLHADLMSVPVTN